MAIGKSDSVHYQNIANSIRRNLSGAEGARENYSPSEMAGGIDAVSDHNYRKGHNDSENSAKNAVGGLARRVFGEERETTVSEVANQALSDFSSIKFELNNRGATVSDIEPTENYSGKIVEVYDKGAEVGYSSGKEAGITEGFETGKQAGIAEGYNTGKAEGYNSGYQIGKVDGKAEVYAQIEPINAQLENTLNGTDTGGKSFYNLVYQDITITQDCTNANQLAEIFNAVVGEDEEIVMFINQNWTSYPDSSTPDNTILNAMIYSSKYRDEENIVRSGYFIRWRDGVAGYVAFLSDAYDINVKAGDVFRKVVLRWKNI